jgi:hypothetical protein
MKLECADYLELALQFGIVVMFASTFPLVAVLALLVSSSSHTYKPVSFLFQA